MLFVFKDFYWIVFDFVGVLLLLCIVCWVLLLVVIVGWGRDVWCVMFVFVGWFGGVDMCCIVDGGWIVGWECFFEFFVDVFFCFVFGWWV